MRPEANPERFVRSFLAVLLLALGAIAGANLVLDPFRAYLAVEIEALRPFRDKLVSRIAKAELLEQQTCPVVILGTSRAQIALDPEHPAWRAPACNLALTGMGARELERVLAHVLARPQVRDLVIALDFVSFERDTPPHEDFERSRFNAELSSFDYHAGLLLGAGASEASYRLLSDLWQGRRAPYTELGLTDPSLRGEVGDRKRFVWALERTLASLEKPDAFDYDADTLEPIARAIRRARTGGVAVTVLILPSHALYYEALQRSGRWPAWERWLRDWVAVLEPEAEPRLAPLWDFTAYSDATSEQVPDAGASLDMRWHWDAVHVKRELGNAAVERACGTGLVGPAGGSELTRANVERHIAQLRETRERYLAAHGDQLGVLDEARARAAAPGPGSRD